MVGVSNSAFESPILRHSADQFQLSVGRGPFRIETVLGT